MSLRIFVDLIRLQFDAYISTKRLITKLTAIFTFFLFAAANSIIAQDYVEITAKIDYLYYDEVHTKQPATKTVHVMCVMGKNMWEMTNDAVKGGLEKFQFDGTNVYKISHATVPPSSNTVSGLAKLGFASAPYDSNLFGIYITQSPNGHPLKLGHSEVDVPWLAFCSGSYLKQSGRIIPLPTALLWRDVDGLAYSDKTETFGDGLGLPRTVDLFTSKALYKTSVHNLCLSGAIRNREYANERSPYPDGILKFHYEVMQSTNVNGWALPLKFEFFQNDPAQDGYWFRRIAGTGEVFSVRSVSEPGSVFSTSVRQTVVDWRFRSAARPDELLIYPWTNSYVPSTNDPDLQKIFAQDLAKAPR
jgi:hypothetical protein